MDKGSIVGAGRNYAIFSEVMDYKMYRETEVREGETSDDATIRLFQEMDALAFKIRAERESMTGVKITQSSPSVIQQGKVDKGKELESLMDSIVMCETVEELAEYKRLAGSNSDVMKIYMGKLKDLTK
jgi:hypothetical protein